MCTVSVGVSVALIDRPVARGCTDNGAALAPGNGLVVMKWQPVGALRS
jgi:hypothetical protein